MKNECIRCRCALKPGDDFMCVNCKYGDQIRVLDEERARSHRRAVIRRHQNIVGWVKGPSSATVLRERARSSLIEGLLA